jgi:hypothetical protein
LIDGAQRATQESNLRPTAPEASPGVRIVNQCATLSEVKMVGSEEAIHGALRCSEMGRHEKAQECVQSARTESSASTEPQLAVGPRLGPTTVDDALRLAIKLAVEVGDYARAGALLEIAKGAPPKPGEATALALPRRRGPP